MLARLKLGQFSFAEVAVFRRPRPDLLTDILLRGPTMGERVFDFLKKDRGKKVTQRILPTPVNAPPIVFVSRCININSDWIAGTTAA